jgi:hypothetical protein
MISAFSNGNIFLNYNASYVIQLADKKCLHLKLIAVICTTMSLFSIIFNGLLLSSFYKNKSLRTSVNIFIICLALASSSPS